MTTLSTVGFGDFHPRSDIERIFGSFFLLFGVMLFSYFMGNLNHMILQFNMIDEDDNYESDLVKFLHTLENYNMGYPLNK